MSVRFLLLTIATIYIFYSNLSFGETETNLEGDEIVITNDNTIPDDQIPNASGLEASPKVNDPALNYLPAPLPDESQATGDINTDDLRQRIINGYKMPDVDSKFTLTQEEWYASRPDYVHRMMMRSQRYLYHIVEEVEKRGMPTEIALLPMIESAFNPQANSRTRASGIWQFMPQTGKNFGLKQNWWVDNRKGVTAATDAALTYLQKLHVMFGTWDLALAAYNAGEGTVQRAIDRNRRRGLPTDYNSLKLPAETKNYVPKLQAIKNIMTSPEQFGLSIESIPNKPYFTTVTAPEQIDAKLAAELAEISFEEFSSLNPEYNRPVLTSNGKAHEILLPVSAATTFQNNLSNYDKPLVSWQTYHAKRGERMDNIAKKFGINLAELRDVNDLPSNRKIRNSGPILVPYSGKTDAEPPIDTTTSISNSDNSYSSNSGQSDNSTTIHVVKNNETLGAIAKEYGTTPRNILLANRLKKTRLKSGQKLIIPETILNNNAQTHVKNSAAKSQHYTVMRGDTLESIAEKFSISEATLKKTNKLKSTKLAVGKKLIIPRQS